MDTQDSQEQKLIIALENIKRLTVRPQSMDPISYREFIMMYAIDSIMKRKNPLQVEENHLGVMISRLGDLLQISRPTATQLVNAMEEKEYLERSYSETDRRVVYIRLTEKGQKVFDMQMSVYSGLLTEVTEKVGKDEIDQLILLCDRFQEAVLEVRSRKLFEQSDEESFSVNSL